jgi:hypothetical protein
MTDRTLLTYKYRPPEGGTSIVGWAPMHCSALGAVLLPSRFVPANDPRSRHTIVAGELFDVIVGSEFHDFVRYDTEHFIPATRAEIASADGKPSPIAMTPPTRPADPGPMWDGTDIPDGGLEDHIWRYATGQGPRLIDKPPRGHFADYE